MHDTARDSLLLAFLRDHPNAATAQLNGADSDAKILATFHADQATRAVPQTQTYRGLPVEWTPANTIRTLELPLPLTHAHSAFDTCQNEPVKLGTQIQPTNKPWVGTAGAPVHWYVPDIGHYYGVLTNWHVMPGGELPAGHRAHQPLDTYPPLGRLLGWREVLPDQTNRVDAALLDSMIEGFHTTHDEILSIGALDPTTLDATPGLAVKKAGRTTGLTQGRCTQTGVAVRVSYGNFTALFADQDIFEPTGGQFSAAGDSGSLIVGQACNCPVALLFAGGGNLTVGNPIRHVIGEMDIDFVYP